MCRTLIYTLDEDKADKYLLESLRGCWANPETGLARPVLGVWELPVAFDPQSLDRDGWWDRSTGAKVLLKTLVPFFEEVWVGHVVLDFQAGVVWALRRDVWERTPQPGELAAGEVITFVPDHGFGGVCTCYLSQVFHPWFREELTELARDLLEELACLRDNGDGRRVMMEMDSSWEHD